MSPHLTFCRPRSLGPQVWHMQATIESDALDQKAITLEPLFCSASVERHRGSFNSGFPLRLTFGMHGLLECSPMPPPPPREFSEPGFYGQRLGNT